MPEEGDAGNFKKSIRKVKMRRKAHLRRAKKYLEKSNSPSRDLLDVGEKCRNAADRELGRHGGIQTRV